MKRYVLSILSFTLLVPSLTHAEITRTLRLGDRGLDVKELQIALNSDPATRIAQSGPGAPGFESTYFGALTQAAVNKFQIKYALEALTPAGLSAPTGIVGPLTRKVLYRLSRTTTPVSQEQPGISTTVSLQAATPQIITSRTQSITLTGSGFTPYNNQIIIASESEAVATTVSSVNGTSLTAIPTFPTIEKMRSQITNPASIPAFASNLRDGLITRSNGVVYMRAILKVKNANGESNTITLLLDVAALLK